MRCYDPSDHYGYSALVHGNVGLGYKQGEVNLPGQGMCMYFDCDKAAATRLAVLCKELPGTRVAQGIIADEFFSPSAALLFISIKENIVPCVTEPEDRCFLPERLAEDILLELAVRDAEGRELSRAFCRFRPAHIGIVMSRVKTLDPERAMPRLIDDLFRFCRERIELVTEQRIDDDDLCRDCNLKILKGIHLHHMHVRKIRDGAAGDEIRDAPPDIDICISPDELFADVLRIAGVTVIEGDEKDAVRHDRGRLREVLPVLVSDTPVHRCCHLLPSHADAVEEFALDRCRINSLCLAL